MKKLAIVLFVAAAALSACGGKSKNAPTTEGSGMGTASGSAAGSGDMGGSGYGAGSASGSGSASGGM